MNQKLEFKCPDGHVHARWFERSACGVGQQHCLEFVGKDPVDGAGLLCWKLADRVRE
jgi:hypothetical protein